MFHTALIDIKKIALITSVAMLSACGGGSGGSSSSTSGPVVSTDTFQVKTAYNNVLWNTNSSSFTLSGNVVTGGTTYPVTGSGNVNRSALTGSTFEGIPGYKKIYTTIGSFTVNGTTRPASVSYTDYVNANYTPTGMISTAEYVVVTSASEVPVTAKVNDSAQWYTANRYTSSSKTKLLGTRTATYALLPDTASTAILTVVITDKNNSGKTTFTNTSRIRITPPGAITPLTEQEFRDNGTEVLNVTYTFQ